MPVTHKAATFTGITITRIVGGKAAETWANFANLGMLHQLGLVPMPG